MDPKEAVTTGTHPSSETPKPKAVEKNEQIEANYRSSLDAATRKTLSELGEVTGSDGRFPSDKYHFVQRILRQRTSPLYQGRQRTHAKVNHSEVTANLLQSTLYGGGDILKKRFPGFVTIEKDDLENANGNRIVEVHYGAGELGNDLDFVKQCLAHPDIFIKEVLDIKKAWSESIQLRLVLHYPQDIPVNEQLLKAVVAEESANFPHNKISTTHEVEIIPFNTEQIKRLDDLADSNRNEISRHPKEKFLEIREVDVKVTIERILSDLPETSSLAKLIKLDPGFFSKQVYESIKNYKSGNLEEAMGYVFEAAVAMEMRDGVMDDTASEMLWQLLNRNRVVKGGVLDLSSPEFTRINAEYQAFMAKKWLSHGDFLVLEGGIVTGIIECKVSALDSIQDGVKKQIISEVASLDSFIEHYNTMASRKGGAELKSLPKKDIKVILVKPLQNGMRNIPSNRIGAVTTAGENLVSILRSAVSAEDMEVVRTHIKEISQDAE